MENDMPVSPELATPSKGILWAGRIVSALPVLMLLFSAAMKFLKPPEVTEGFVKLGYTESLAMPLGIVELVCTVLYVFPRTAVLGAILLTGYLGGAVATHLRVENPLLGYTLFPLYVAALVWGGLYLGNERLRAVVPLTR